MIFTQANLHTGTEAQSITKDSRFCIGVVNEFKHALHNLSTTSLEPVIPPKNFAPSEPSSSAAVKVL